MLAHNNGVPPQFIKGQVTQESGFDPTAYRYEVLSVDLNYISSSQNLRSQIPYSSYRLATSDGLAAGDSILPADISPRSIYNITVNGVIRPIGQSDALVSAKDIYDTNDSVQAWSNNSPKRAAAVERN